MPKNYQHCNNKNFCISAKLDATCGKRSCVRCGNNIISFASENRKLLNINLGCCSARKIFKFINKKVEKPAEKNFEKKPQQLLLGGRAGKIDRTLRLAALQ